MKRGKTMTTINAEKMDYSQMAYKLTAVTELMDVEESTRGLSHDVYSGIRLVLEESAESLLNVDDSAGYKLLTVAALLDTPEECEQIEADVWSGARLIIEDVTRYLHDC